VTRFHLHLVSDSTDETVHSVARACLVQFDEVNAVKDGQALLAALSVMAALQSTRLILGAPGRNFYIDSAENCCPNEPLAGA
jgi:regulator of PEP synthase PpsR (kinase-PPPase family)